MRLILYRSSFENIRKRPSKAFNVSLYTPDAGKPFILTPTYRGKRQYAYLDSNTLCCLESLWWVIPQIYKWITESRSNSYGFVRWW